MTQTIEIKRIARRGEYVAEVLPMTRELVEKISRFNTFLDYDATRDALIAGRRIYTSFNYYERA